MEKRLGQISTMTAITVVGGALAIGAWVINYVQSQVNPIEQQEQINQTAIVGVQSDVSWIKAALQAKGFSPPANNYSLETSTQP